MDIDAYLAKPCEMLTEGEYQTMVQEYKYQRAQKRPKIIAGIIGGVVIGCLSLIFCITGDFTDSLFPLELIVGVGLGNMAGSLAFSIGSFFEPEYTQITNGKKLTKQQLKALKSKIKEYENLHEQKVGTKTISYKDYKKQQGITNAQTNQIEVTSQKPVAPSNDENLNSNL